MASTNEHCYDAQPDDAWPDDAWPDDAWPDDARPDDAWPDDLWIKKRETTTKSAKEEKTSLP